MVTAKVAASAAQSLLYVSSTGSDKHAFEDDGSTQADANDTTAPTADSTFRLAGCVFAATNSRGIYWTTQTNAAGNGTSITDLVSTYNRINIGARNDAGTVIQFANASIAEVHFYNGSISGGDFDSLAAGALPETITGWVDGWTLLTASTLTSIGGTRTLTAVGGVTTSGVAHPITRSPGGGETLMGAQCL